MASRCVAPNDKVNCGTWLDSDACALRRCLPRLASDYGWAWRPEDKDPFHWLENRRPIAAVEISGDVRA
jgi:hypothetical protein